jgi:hypothetical protein
LRKDFSESKAEDALRYLTRRRDRSDPLLGLLNDAPDDLEPVSPEEERGAREAWVEYMGGERTPLDQVRRKLS